jgi:hypothetical protein
MTDGKIYMCDWVGVSRIILLNNRKSLWDIVNQFAVMLCKDAKVCKGFRNQPTILANLAGWSAVGITLECLFDDLIAIAVTHDSESSMRTCEWISAFTNFWAADFE